MCCPYVSPLQIYLHSIHHDDSHDLKKCSGTRCSIVLTLTASFDAYLCSNTQSCYMPTSHADTSEWFCRFLQGKNTDEQAVKDIRHAIQEASETTVRLLNYKKSGKAFWNMFTLAPMADVDGTARFLIGVQVDVTAVEEALPEGLKATNAGPHVPKGAANAITAGQPWQNMYSSCSTMRLKSIPKQLSMAHTVHI